MVTFHPDSRLVGLMRSVAPQVAEVLIVDNGSEPDERALVRDTARDSGARVIQNEANRGVAAALNQGCDELSARGHRSILLLDQDALPEPDMVSRLLDVRAAAVAPERVAIVGSGTPFTAAQSRCRGRAWVEMREVITSGSLLDLDAMRVAGPFREDFFVDYVDVEYCLRLRRLGYVIVAACSVTMRHEVGSPQPRRFLFWTVTPSRHSAARRYYITRNRLQVWRRYGTAEPGYLVTDAIRFLKELVKLLLYEERRRAKLASVWRGARDAVRGRTGATIPVG